MPKTTTFNSKYGYVRHPDDKDGVCFWCGDEAVNTWDYTPCRDIAQFPDIMKMIGETPTAVTACKKCIATSLYRKSSHRTIEAKRRLFADVRRAREEKRAKYRNMASMHPWQWRDLESGRIYDYPEETLSIEILQMKREFEMRNTASPVEVEPPTIVNGTIMGDWDEPAVEN